MSANPQARLACVTVLKTSLIAIDEALDKQGNNRHVKRLVWLKHWARTLNTSVKDGKEAKDGAQAKQAAKHTIAPERITYHVIEGTDPAQTILRYAEHNQVDHIIIGSRGSSTLQQYLSSYLGSVSTAVVAQASCTVTVVKIAQPG